MLREKLETVATTKELATILDGLQTGAHNLRNAVSDLRNEYKPEALETNHHLKYLVNDFETRADAMETLYASIC